jgi:hypothetical protein
MNKFSLVLFFSVLSFSNAFAQTGASGLQSISGTQIKLSFHPGSTSGDTSTYALVDASVQLSNQDAAAQTVNLVFVSNCSGAITSNTFGMAPIGGGAFTDRGNPVKVPTFSAAGACTQEIAIEAGNNWLKDPLNPNSSNFKYQIQ